MKSESSSQDPEDKSLNDEIKEGIYNAYKTVVDWMRPSKKQALPLQVLLLILKLPVLLLILLLSPVILIILLFVFLAVA